MRINPSTESRGTPEITELFTHPSPPVRPLAGRRCDAPGPLSGTKVSRYENFTRMPGVLTIFALEIVFNQPASELFAGSYDAIRCAVSGVDYFFGSATTISPGPRKCGNLACCWRDFQGARGKGGKPAFWLSTLPTAPSFPQPTSFRFFVMASSPGASFAGGLTFRFLILLGLLRPVARDVQLDDHAVVCQAVDGGPPS